MTNQTFDTKISDVSLRSEHSLAPQMAHQGFDRPKRAVAPVAKVSDLRIAVVSDAIAGRNGVGTFYLDLLAQIEGDVARAELISPKQSADYSLERFALPLPGDKTQRLAWPRRRELNARLDQLRPNLIVIPSLGPFSFFAFTYARKNQISVVVVNHTDFDHLLSLYWTKWAVWPLRIGLNAVNRWLCKRATAVGVMHSEALETAKRHGAKVVRVMGTPLSSDFLSRPIQPLTETVTRAVFVGRLAKEKGIADLLKAVRLSPQTHFTIVGDGPLREEIEATAKVCKNLTYRGWLSRSGVLIEIDAADVLVLPSAYETFGTVALEALARQRYVIASSGCGITKWHALADGIFLTSDAKDLKEVLDDIQKMEPLDRRQKAAKSWQAVEAFNSQAVNEWLNLFCDAAHAQSR